MDSRENGDMGSGKWGSELTQANNRMTAGPTLEAKERGEQEGWFKSKYLSNHGPHNRIMDCFPTW